MTTSTSTPNTKNGTAPRAQDETPRDLASAVTITYTPLTEVRAKAQAPDVPLPVDLPTLTDEVLAALIQGARAELQQRRAKREADFFALVSAQAKVLGVTPSRLAAVLAGKAPAASADGTIDGRKNVKRIYWNPKDHDQRWTGRGTPPKWMADHQEAGGTLEECLIPEGEL